MDTVNYCLIKQCNSWCSLLTANRLSLIEIIAQTHNCPALDMRDVKDPEAFESTLFSTCLVFSKVAEARANPSLRCVVPMGHTGYIHTAGLQGQLWIAEKTSYICSRTQASLPTQTGTDFLKRVCTE